MSGQHLIRSSSSGRAVPGSPREILSDAIHYWERRRIVYNLALAVVVMAWLVSTWPHFRHALTPQSFLLLFVLAMLANVCYSAAYLADLPIQDSSFQTIWLRWRWSLWATGMTFAIAIANYWIADEIYPYVR